MALQYLIKDKQFHTIHSADQNSRLCTHSHTVFLTCFPIHSYLLFMFSHTCMHQLLHIGLIVSLQLQPALCLLIIKFIVYLFFFWFFIFSFFAIIVHFQHSFLIDCVHLLYTFISLYLHCMFGFVHCIFGFVN